MMVKKSSSQIFVFIKMYSAIKVIFFNDDPYNLSAHVLISYDHHTHH